MAHARGRLAAAGIVLSGSLAGVVALSYLAMTTDFATPETVALPDVNDKPVVTRVGDPGPTPAERTVDAVIGTRLAALADWDASDVSTTVAAMSPGFGCDARDGLAPVTGRSRSYASDAATLDVSVAAYPAGGGALALDGMTTAAAACPDAYLDYVPSTLTGLGVAVEGLSSDRVSSVVWRRGDVLVTASVSAYGRAGDLSAHAASFAQIDKALDDALTGTCVDQEADAQAASRSPYLNRRRYTGRKAVEQVTRPASKARPAEKRTKHPVVTIPGPELTLPDVGTLPTVPVPAPLRGPNRLPTPEPTPVLPDVPTKPDLTAQVEYRVADPDGPGCGWAFTGQEAPSFNADRAELDRRDMVESTRKRLDRAWRGWQRARLDYFRDYARYTRSYDAYTVYTEQVAEAREAWAVIETARAEYWAAHAAWEESVRVRDEHLAAVVVARDEYRAAKEACRTVPDPETEPDPDAPVCPAVRPAILDEPVPEVGPEPVPSPEAQLSSASG